MCPGGRSSDQAVLQDAHSSSETLSEMEDGSLRPKSRCKTAPLQSQDKPPSREPESCGDVAGDVAVRWKAKIRFGSDLACEMTCETEFIL